MKSLYQIVSIATSALLVYLFSQAFFFSDSFVEGFGLEPSIATQVLAPRTSMFMLGLAVLMFSSRNLPASNTRQFICLSIGITFFGCACLGTYELIKGTVNSSILVAISIETILWILYGIIFIKDKLSSRALVLG